MSNIASQPPYHRTRHMGRKVFSSGLGKYFEELRVSKDWSQRQAEDIAINRKKLVALNRQTIFRLERGVIKHPSADVLRAVSALYDVSYDEVVSAVTAHVYGSDLPGHSAAQDSSTDADQARGGPQHAPAPDTARLVALAAEAGRREGQHEALARLAAIISDQIQQLDREDESAHTPSAATRKISRNRRR